MKMEQNLHLGFQNIFINQLQLRGKNSPREGNIKGKSKEGKSACKLNLFIREHVVFLIFFTGTK